jgi:hypothetical protein
MQNLANLFSQEELQYLITLPEVLEAKETLGRFRIPITPEISSTLKEKLGLDFSNKTSIPMRWIKGDTAPHIDSGASTFKNTYLVYLTDSEGEFIIGEESFPIIANTSFIFNEGIQHKTLGTGVMPRLLLGPMNEFTEPVGGGGVFIYYYSNYADAIAETNSIGLNNQYWQIRTIGLVTSGDPVAEQAVAQYRYWRIAKLGDGSSFPNISYRRGYNIGGDVFPGSSTAVIHLYPSLPCFLEGTTVLCEVDGTPVYLPIETIKPGTLVKTSLNGYKKVDSIGSGQYYNSGSGERIENSLYKCSTVNYPELKQDLFITGCHSLLVDKLTEEQREGIIKTVGKIFVTDKKYRLMASVDERAEPWNSEGNHSIWNLALENDDPKMNYGIYVNGGLLVETCSINTLRNKSNLTLA